MTNPVGVFANKNILRGGPKKCLYINEIHLVQTQGPT